MDKHAGKLAAAAAFAAVLIIGLTAQEPGSRGRELQPPKPSTAYTVGGISHGISYFPRAGYDFTKPKAAGVMDFSHYHTYGEVTAFLANGPRIIRTSSISIPSGSPSKAAISGRSRSPTSPPARTRTSRPCSSKGTGIRARSRRPSPPSGSPGTS